MVFGQDTAAALGARQRGSAARRALGQAPVRRPLAFARSAAATQVRLGKAAINAEVSLLEIESSGSGPVSSPGTWAIKFETRAGQEYGLIFSETEHAIAVEEVLRDTIDRAQAQAIEFLERLDPNG
jgi:hypothetical protein